MSATNPRWRLRLVKDGVVSMTPFDGGTKPPLEAQLAMVKAVTEGGYLFAEILDADRFCEVRGDKRFNLLPDRKFFTVMAVEG